MSATKGTKHKRDEEDAAENQRPTKQQRSSTDAAAAAAEEEEDVDCKEVKELKKAPAAACADSPELVDWHLRNLNPHLSDLEVDHMYHLGLDSSMDLKGMFSDVKFVCLGGSAERMHSIIQTAAVELGLSHLIPVGCKLASIGKTERYHLYKLGPLIAVNHGMGMPSLSILLHELTKLLHYAGATDFVYIRIGTCGGLGVEPGTVILTETSYNSALQPCHRATVLGQIVERPSTLNRALSEAIYACRGEIPALIGNTMVTDDFYEEQARMDGFFCDFDAKARANFVERCHELGIRNIEMESGLFASFCHRANIPGAVLCAALVNRLKGDQVASTHDQLASYANNAITLALRYIKTRLHSSQ